MTTLTTSSHPMTANKDGSGVDWVEAIEKMNSTPDTATPRQEANNDSNTAVSTSAAPTAIALTKKEEGVQITSSPTSTMRIVPQSPVEEQNTIAEADARPMTPLEISGDLSEEKNSKSISPSTEMIVAVELRMEEEVVEVSGLKGNIPEDQNSDTKTSTIDQLSDGAIEVIKSAPEPPLPINTTGSISETTLDALPVDSINSTSDTTQEDGSMHPVAIQLEETTSAISQEEKEENKAAEVMKDSIFPSPVDVPDKIKRNEASSSESALTSSVNVLDENKEDAVSDEAPNSSQPTAEKQTQMDSDLEEKPDVAITTEKSVEVEETTLAPASALEEEKPKSSDFPEESQLRDQKDLPHATLTSLPARIDDNLDSLPPNQPNATSEPSTHPDAPTSIVSKPKKEHITDNKKGLYLFTKIKRKLSTRNMKDLKEDVASTTPTTAVSFIPSPTTAASSPNSSIEGPQHIELAKTVSKSSTTASPREGKRSDGLFKTLRAAMSFSGRRSPKTPTISKTGQTPVPSPIATRARTWDKKTPPKPSSPTAVKSPIRPSTAKAVLKSQEKVPTIAKPAAKSPLYPTIKKTTAQIALPKSPLSPVTKDAAQISLPKPQPPVRRLSRHSPVIKAALRQAQTWSPPGSTPVLASNPNAKLYTIWPCYPVVRVQTDEVQAVLEGFLPNDLDAIEKECAPGRDANVDESINFWKAPLTGEQAEVVKALQFVSAIQLSKLDYDPSDYFS